MNREQLVEELSEFRSLSEKLRQYRDAEYPTGTDVKVNCTGRYTGPGKAVYDPECPVDKLPVQLQNDNVWWYPIENCIQL